MKNNTQNLKSWQGLCECGEIYDKGGSSVKRIRCIKCHYKVNQQRATDFYHKYKVATND